LHARPLDDNLQKEALRAWYEKRGFQWRGDDQDTMIKNLV